MPITIWKPREYAEGFAQSTTIGGLPYVYINGETAAEPYNRDTKVREVTRFTGWTQQYYANTGEMEITIPAGQVEPSDISKRHLVNIDGQTFMIEEYSWEITDQGYQCTISGRDLCGRLDREVAAIKKAAEPVYGTLGDILDTGERFLAGAHSDGYDIELLRMPETCGWFRDTDRIKDPDGYVKAEIDGTWSRADKFNAEKAGEVEVTDYGALLRYMCNFFDLGYRFDIEYNETKGLHTVQLVFYRKNNAGVIMRSTDRGVSGFKYEFTARDSINAAFICARSRWQFQDGGDLHSDEPIYGRYRFPFKKEGANWAEVANEWRGRAIDLGEIPQENDETLEAGEAWIDQQTGDIYKNDGESVEFSYNNSGVYKYGEHFGLGSVLTIVDEYLNVAATKRLYGVKKNYEAGEVVQFDFEFGDQRVTQADKLKKRFAELDRKTYSLRG